VRSSANSDTRFGNSRTAVSVQSGQFLGAERRFEESHKGVSELSQDFRVVFYFSEPLGDVPIR